MKKKRICCKSILSVLLIAVLAVSLAACGSSSSYDKAAMAVEAPAAMENTSIYSAAEMAGVTMEEAAEEEAMAEDAGIAEGGETVGETTQTERKLIKTVHLDVETEDYPTMIQAVNEKVNAAGGYIEFYESYNENNIGHRGSNFKLRIPAQKLDSFIEEVGEISNITYRQESVEDVTLQYVDLESHKKMLLEEQERLLELLAEAETIEDIISIESRLTEVRYQLESMESQLRTIDNKVTYSTIHLNINEVTRYTPPVEKGAWERITTGFTENVYDVIDGLKEFGINFVISIPILLVYAVLIIILIIVIRIVRKRIMKGKQKQKEVSGMYGSPAVKNTESEKKEE